MYRVNHGDIKDWAKNYDGPLFDGILCDPPYELGFMGKSWDSTGIAFDVEMWQNIYKLLKPGAHLLAFSGSRTYHRMAVAIEDAGFEIRDMIEWVYGSGFPKSLNIGKAVDKLQGNERERFIRTDGAGTSISGKKTIYGSGVGKSDNATSEFIDTKGNSDWEGYGTALKPAHEPCVLARKPIEGTVAQNCLKHGVGGLNIDGSRVDFGNESDSRVGTEALANGFSNGAVNFGINPKGKDIKMYKSNGRFPANLIHDGSDEVLEVFPETKSGSMNSITKGHDSNTFNTYGKQYVRHVVSNGDSGSAARFFYNAKPDLYCSLCYDIMEVCENNAQNAQQTSQLGTQANNTVQDSVAVKQVQELKDSKPSKTNNALNAVNGSVSTSPTTESTVQPNVTQNLKELLDLTAKYAESQCLKCQISIAQKLVVMATENMELQACQDFTQDYKNSTQTENLVSTVEYLANIDITQTTINLMKLCGCARLATDENTKQESQKNNNGIYRLKYTAKASKSERNAGLEGFEEKRMATDEVMKERLGSNWENINRPHIRATPRANHHPTVKPLALTKYLANLIKPPKGGRLLVPFSGSGSEMIGALQAGWEYVEGVELTEEYIPIAEARIKYWLEQKDKQTKLI